MRILVVFLCLSCFATLYANDGAYYTSGNHLIPMIETRIQVKKEILTLKRVNENELLVTVYYEFFNPDEEKKLDVGFEADGPSGDVNGTPKKGKHPYISDFTVSMNDSTLPYKVTIVGDSMYYKNGKFIPKTSAEIKEALGNVNYVGFKYAYHFKATFKKGINIVKHTYRFRLSSSVDLIYDFNYILTAANRWGNAQIDDFLLEIDMGELESYKINHGFFNAHKDWLIAGSGIKKDVKTNRDYYGADSASQFYIRNGKILFQKMNFKPKAELFLFAENYLGGPELFDYRDKEDVLPFNEVNRFSVGKDEFSLKILKNLPYARRGYVFKNAELQAYFEKMEWYLADPAYVADLAKITEKEKAWLKELKLSE